MARTCAAVSSTAWRTPSITTKSLPWPCILVNLQPHGVIFADTGEGSPGGRVLKRLWAQKYCSGCSRTRSSMKAFMRRTSASRSSVGKSSHGG